MKSREHLAIIGSGPSALYLLKHLLDAAEAGKPCFRAISIFEKSAFPGAGMPYNPETTDSFNLSNISSEEIPALSTSLADWLRALEPDHLKELGLENTEISDGAIYSRLALGRYLQAQFKALIPRLAELGVEFHEYANREVTDARVRAGGNCVTLSAKGEGTLEFDRLVVATGHRWPEEDRPEAGYYASPWPIFKLLPEKGCYFNFTIGTLGASLSAFDVISSLAHRHGMFTTTADGGMTFHPHPGAERFNIVMHSAQGLLPHLQFAQTEPLRDVYRHVERAELLALVNSAGFLRLETYFDKICRPALRKAFEKDGAPEMARLLEDSSFAFEDFVKRMTDKHNYADPFEGMRREMREAARAVKLDRPVHWKETLDDLMYTLNFHAELLPAEDHMALRSTVMPFLMNVIAAMPLASARLLLALRDASVIDLVAGNVEIAEKQESDGGTTVKVEDESGETLTASYRLFIDCGGQRPVEPKDYPLPGLVESGVVRKARARFAQPDKARGSVPEESGERLFEENGEPLYHTGGIDIDPAGRLIGRNGKTASRIYDITPAHMAGTRPYSYGLQACNDTAAILAAALLEDHDR